LIIYLDIIFLENVFMNFIILYACKKILKSEIKIVRIIVSCALGAIYACLLYLTNLEIYSNILLKIILSFSMVFIAFNSKNLNIFLKQILVFYLTSFTFGGVAIAFIYFVNPENIVLKNGVLVGTYPLKMILLGGIFGFFLITMVFKNIKERFNKNNLYCKIELKFMGKKLNTRAIVDTGNFLKDPITKDPVIIIEKKELNSIIPLKILNELDNLIVNDNLNLEKYLEKIRLIPFKSIGKNNGILTGIKVDNVEVKLEENTITINNCIVGIYNGILSKTGRFHCLIGLDILEANDNNKLIYE